MVLENGEKRRLVTNVGDALVVKVVKASYKRSRATVDADQLGLIMGNETGKEIVNKSLPSMRASEKKEKGAHWSHTSRTPRDWTQKSHAQCFAGNMRLPNCQCCCIAADPGRPMSDSGI